MSKGYDNEPEITQHQKDWRTGECVPIQEARQGKAASVEMLVQLSFILDVPDSVIYFPFSDA